MKPEENRKSSEQIFIAAGMAFIILFLYAAIDALLKAVCDMNSVLTIPTECPCELSGPEECQACNDRKNASMIETQQELIQKLFFENQMLKQAVRELRNG